ncbi:HipA N-terminal domain-containing protein [Sorangium sp. So ce131]|uniref:HipA N-terminal domain-containing protein n=1 Tax=Sorangium sp. So ce131 TaxID=3133282 RepID=UPI003F5D806B
MVQQKPITLLHLSDMQFGPHHRFEGPNSPGSLLHRLRDDLDRLRDEEGIRPDLVLLTGDLTEYGMKSQFDQLLSFAHGLTELTELAPRRVVVVPGNHDVNWKLCQAYFAEREGNEERPSLPYWPKLRPYAEFFARFYEGQTGIQFTEAEPWSLFEYPDLRVVVAGLNSAIAEGHRPEDHYGFAGEQQLRFFAGKLRPYKEQGFLRIAAIHHDPLHPGENDAARQDAKDLKGMLRPYLNLVVHGHLHEEQLGWLDNDVPVLGIGSAGVKVPERPPEVPNQYQVVQVYPDRLTYGTRAYVPDQKRWIGCLRSDPEGRAWRIEKRVAFERVEGTFSGRAEAVAAPLADLAQMVDAYRRHWANAYRREALFDLATMGEDADVPAGLDLLHVFLPQTARREPPRLDLPRDIGGELAEEGLVGAPRQGRAEDARSRIALTGAQRPIDQVVTSPGEPWVLILGAPGAGKSALTRWLVLKLSAPGESLGDLPADLVPVRIELRRFDLHYRSCRQAGRSCDFFDYLDEVHRERNLSLRGEPLRRLAEAGRLLWLFDGLDEVADPHARRDYAAMIVGARDRYAGRGVVTSRIVGARPAQPLFQQAGLATYTLQEFDDRQIDAFLERWHRLAFPGAPEAAARRLERLRQTLKESRPVRELCSNPLLLTLIALLNRGAELPRQRHRLYERAVDLMAEQWEANKHLAATSAIQFDLPSKKRFLRKLAFLMMTELTGGSGNAVRQQDLSAFAASFCAEEYGLRAEEAKATAEQLIQHLRERNYILALVGGQTFGFVHKTFLEYLTATEIHARFRTHDWGLDEIKAVFKKSWQDQAWEETLTLICGMIEEERPQQVVELLQSVLEDVDPFEDYRMFSFVSFAIRCVAEIRLLDQEPVRSFARKLTDCILGYHFRSWYLDSHRLPSALQLRGPEWPDAARIVAGATKARSRGADDDTHRLRFLNRCALAVSTKQERITRLRELVANQADEPRFLDGIIQAGHLGEWTADEALSLHDIVERLKEPARSTAWIALLDSGMAWASRPVASIMRDHEDPRRRYSAARALLRIPEWRSEAVSTMVNVFRSGFEDVNSEDLRRLLEAAEETPLREQVRSLLHADSVGLRERVALEMALRWHDEAALSIWVGALFNEGDELLFSGVDVATLQRLASEHAGAQRALSRVLDDITTVKNLNARVVIAQWMVARNDPRGVDVLREIAFSDSCFAPIRQFAAGALLNVPSGRQLGVDALVLLVSAGSDFHARQAFFDLLDHASSLPEARAGLWRLIEEGLRDDLRLTVCQTLASLDSGGRADALRHIHQLAAAAEDETVRVRAAAYLHHNGLPTPEWRPVLVHLARSAKRGSTRLLAAMGLRDEARIARLAARAKSSKVRKDAAAALERLRVYRALLHVGRPRRGIVSFDGTRAGIIEETPDGSRFIYDRDYLARPDAVPLSPTLPLRPEPYESRGLHPFFENLLPEGWLLDQTCRKLGLDRTDAFGLMLATCADCAGAVEIVPEKLPVAA